MRPAIAGLPDYDPDTIPDHYLSLLADRPRAATRDPVRGLATMAGAYFGGRPPAVSVPLSCRRLASVDWRIEFTYWLLTFHPVAVAWSRSAARRRPAGRRS